MKMGEGREERGKIFEWRTRRRRRLLFVTSDFLLLLLLLLNRNIYVYIFLTFFYITSPFYILFLFNYAFRDFTTEKLGEEEGEIKFRFELFRGK